MSEMTLDELIETLMSGEEEYEQLAVNLILAAVEDQTW